MTVETKERTGRRVPKIANQIVAFVRQHPGVARAYGVTIDANGQPNPETLRSAAERFMLIRIHLEQLETSVES